MGRARIGGGKIKRVGDAKRLVGRRQEGWKMVWLGAGGEEIGIVKEV